MAETARREVAEETGLLGDVEETLGDVSYWYARRTDDGRPVRVWKRVRFFLLRYRSGRFTERDDELDDVRWFPLEEAEQTVSYTSEQALVRRASDLLASRS
jgi:8-oxo-dGTP pyrophosphatase MutT (NUDIX family)